MSEDEDVRIAAREQQTLQRPLGEGGSLPGPAAESNFTQFSSGADVGGDDEGDEYWDSESLGDYATPPQSISGDPGDTVEAEEGHFIGNGHVASIAQKKGAIRWLSPVVIGHVIDGSRSPRGVNYEVRAGPSRLDGDRAAKAYETARNMTVKPPGKYSRSVSATGAQGLHAVSSAKHTFASGGSTLATGDTLLSLTRRETWTGDAFARLCLGAGSGVGANTHDEGDMLR